MTEKHHPGESSEFAPRPSGRPSLTGQQQPAANSGESVSILSAVNQPRQPAPSPVPTVLTRALPWLGIAALIAIGVVFWIELGKTKAPDAEIATASPVSGSPTTTVNPPAAAAPVAPASPVEPVPQVATIENEKLAPVAADKPKPAAVAPAESPKAVDSRKTAAADPVRQRSPFAAMEPPKSPVKSKPAPATPTSNSDVDLLQALLAVTPEHATAGDAAKAAAAAKAKAAVKPKSVVVAKASSRDVVNNDPVIGTGELVRRCEKLGVLESELCKTRICSGIWGKDAACPLPSTAAPEVN